MLFPRAEARPKQAQTQGQGTGQAKVDEKMFPTGVTWSLQTLNGKQITDPPSLKIDENFRATGYSGCNTFSAALYPVRGMRLAMGPIATTRKQCAADRMLLERAYLTILHSGPSWDVAGSGLTVKSPAGSLDFKRGF